MPSTLAPIVIFAFNRASHTQALLHSLLRCKEAAISDLYVFIDGPRNDADKDAVNEVRTLFQQLSGFRSIHITARETNQGLASSVINGVTQILSLHDAAIVLEDDLVVSSDFLSFMNQALVVYKERKDIWSISGYTPRLEIPSDYTHQSFLVPRAQCWGWATWQDRWNTVDWSVKDYHKLKSRQEREAFNRGGNDLSRTLDMERHGKIESWAIRWAFAAYLYQGYTLNPIHSKVQNGGMAQSDNHAGWHDSRHFVELSDVEIQLEPNIQPDEVMIRLFKQHHDLGVISRIGYFMRSHDLGYHFVKKYLFKSH